MQRRNQLFFLMFLSLLALGVCGNVRGGQSSPQRLPIVSPIPPYPAKALEADEADLLRVPAVGEHGVRVLSPTVLELSLVTTEAPNARPTQWDFATPEGSAHLPAVGAFAVTVAGKDAQVAAVGFKRRVLYAPLKPRDLRIGNSLYLHLKQPIAEGEVVEVRNPDQSLWKSESRWIARAETWRLSPVLHVNQVGYMPEYAKQAMVGGYLGSLGELSLDDAARRFELVDAATGKVVYDGPLVARPDRGWTYTTLPYQHVAVADFTAFRTPGRYRLRVAGLGVSLSFRIDEGTAAAFARTYALGLYHQRCGTDNALPFTRFVHAACHIAPAMVPTAANRNAQHQLSGETVNYKENPRHTAPPLKDVDSSLYPFVRQGAVDVSGGHHDAGDYSKYTINSAQLVHTLIFAADNFPGAADLDNLGLPESGDGIGDLLQEAKWEADFLAKMQDDDGGFYFLVYPRDRAYENDVLPDHGDPQIVFPKTTAVTAAAVAALAQAASSPRFQRAFPKAAANYLREARKGWDFLERAQAKYGADGSYQKITHYGDVFMHDDEIAWAATEMYLATGEPRFHDRLRRLFDPAGKNTLHWGWERLFDSYGCAIRSYAFAVRSGRLKAAQLDPVYLQKCRDQIIAGAQDHVDWALANAYGTSFPIESKRFRTAGWYFATAQAFDIAVANVLEPQPGRLEAIIGNLNFEAGCNPNDVVFLTGLGYKRQHAIVHQYAMNARESLPPSGIPLGSVTEGFMYLENYKSELGTLTYPGDGVGDRAYPMYDRWGDSFNVATEFTIPIQGRCLATLSYLMGVSALKTQPWRAASAILVGLPTTGKVGTPLRLTIKATGLPLKDAQIVWESTGNAPTLSATYTFTPVAAGPQWIEAEAQLPDGRRAFVRADFNAAP